MTKKFKVASDLLQFVTVILNRRGIPFAVTDDGCIETDLSGHQFHKVVVRARCEKTDYEQSGNLITIPRIHVSELYNKTVLGELGINEYSDFRIVEK